MKCSDFWLFNGNVDGFGETAFATESAVARSAEAPVQELFQQSVYQFASDHAASTVYGQVSARYKACKSVSSADGHGARSSSRCMPGSRSGSAATRPRK